MIILLMVGFPYVVWSSGRVTELIVVGEEERVPEKLEWLAKKKYIERERKHDKWKLGVIVAGLFFPTITLCSATAESLIPRLMVVLTSAIVFFIGVVLLEWLVRPRSG